MPTTDEPADAMSKALEQMMLSQLGTSRFVETLRTLAIEYQDKAITPERFAERCYREIAAYLKGPTGKPAAAPESTTANSQAAG